MKQQLKLVPHATIPLDFDAPAEVLGIAPDGTLYVEEFYDDTWIRQHIIGPGLQRHDTRDEQSPGFRPLNIPAELTRTSSTFPPLTFDTGAFPQGNRVDSRVDDLVYPLDIAQKMALSERLGLQIPPPLLIGLLRSHIHSVTDFDETTIIICRRITVACALASPETALDGTLLTYTSASLQVLQHINRHSPPDVTSLDGEIHAQGLTHPLQALYHQQRLYVVNQGQPTSIRIFEMQSPQ